MKILAIVRQVPDAEETVHVRDGCVDLDASKLVMDTMDEYGVEQGLRLLEAGGADEVILLAVGPERAQEALRSGLAMGASRAIHVLTSEPLDPISLSEVAAQVAQEEAVELILTGGQQADWDSQALGAATAERLGWPQATWTKELAVENGRASGRHDLDEGSESFAVFLPLVVTTQQGLNEPRYPTVPNIMRAKKKEIRRETMDRFHVNSAICLLSVGIQVKARGHRMVDGKDAGAAAAAAIDFLRNEAGVLA